MIILNLIPKSNHGVSLMFLLTWIVGTMVQGTGISLILWVDFFNLQCESFHPDIDPHIYF
ncbi:hypothetical protein Hdeb2414_s0032g00710831 [Helianthus debilis subsp. tardiflorus]